MKKKTIHVGGFSKKTLEKAEKAFVKVFNEYGKKLRKKRR